MVRAAKLAPGRGVSTSSALFGLKESARDVDNRHIEVERYKRDLLQKQKRGVGHWEEGLASDSESAVRSFFLVPFPLPFTSPGWLTMDAGGQIKADRGEMDPNQEINKLQEEAGKLADKTKIVKGKVDKF
ncbi:hypothetical protein FGG08_000416 [Glutinoglossum americanum]|uniref:Uncharacterized protein n=1 Tax=Glutinoglossum americanum TaxID=1670608 RepID=A0A9P8IDD2_9PEZI|nr:hypothetical protein FGG08_000416 [Glutinoglossum americanum]